MKENENLTFVFLCLLQRHESDMPPYFKFLTIMAYYVFLKEKVDVAVVEVGIGGEYDCTNVIRWVYLWKKKSEWQPSVA